MPDGTGHAEITGTHVHAGREWYTSVWSYGDEMVYTECMAPESELVCHAEYYEPGVTEPLLGLELVEYDAS